MSNKEVFAQTAKNILDCQKWKPTTLHLGTRVEKRQKKIVKCCAEIAIGENRGNKKIVFTSI